MCCHSSSLNTQAMRLRRLKRRDRASTAMPAWTRPIIWLQQQFQDQRPNPYVMKELNITYDHIPSPTELALASRHPRHLSRSHALALFFLLPSILTPTLPAPPCFSVIVA